MKITDIYHKDRPLSYSALSSWKWSKQQWYDKYVLNIPTVITPELEFGSYVDKRIQADPTFLPTLERYPIMQHEMRAKVSGIYLVGYADHFDPTGLRLKDDKTGRKAWDTKRANETEQLTMYAALLYLIDKIPPDDMRFFIDWMPTHYVDKKIDFIKEGDIHTFETHRSLKQVLEFLASIPGTLEEMERYTQSRLSPNPTFSSLLS